MPVVSTNLIVGEVLIRSYCAITSQTIVILAFFLSVFSTANGSTECERSRVLLNQAESLFDEAKSDSAIELAEATLTELEANTIQCDSVVGDLLFALGNFYNSQGNFRKSATMWKRALEIRLEIFGENHPEVASNLIKIANSFEIQGKYSEAEQRYKKAMVIRIHHFGNESIEVAEILSLQSILRWYQEDLVTAEKLARQTLNIRQKKLGNSHKETARAMGNLALVLKEMGKTELAAKYYYRALGIFERLGPGARRYIASTLNNLSIIEKRGGNLKRAEELQRKALAINEEVYGPDHPRLSATLVTMAGIYAALGKYEEATELYRRQIKIKQKAHGKGHPSIAFSLFGLANLFRKSNNLDSADHYYSHALTIYENYLGPGNSLVARTLGQYCRSQFISGDYAGAVKSARRAYDIRRRIFAKNAWIFSESDALNYSLQMKVAADLCLSLIFAQPELSPAMMVEAADIILLSKGSVSDGLYERSHHLFNRENSSHSSDFYYYREARTELASLLVGRSNSEPGRNQAISDSLQGVIDSLENNLILQSSEFRKIFSVHKVDHTSLPGYLPPRTALIEYMRIVTPGMLNDGLSGKYLAAVYSDSGLVEVIDLGDAGPIDSACAVFRSHIIEVAETWPALSQDQVNQEIDLNRYLYDVIWSPAESILDQFDHVLVAPDGALSLISFAALRSDDNSFLCEKQTIHYLSAARDLVRLDAATSPGSGLLAIGDVDYDKVSTHPYGSIAELDASDSEPNSSSQLRSFLPDCDDMFAAGLKPLAYTNREVKQVAKLWTSNGRSATTTLLGSFASESRFKQLAGGKEVIHIATHGYFYPVDCLTGETGSSDDDRIKALKHPLMRSGLFLAGANGKEIADSNNDGILTAYEVATVNLTGVSWVVLSACESGLGDISRSEGLYGLRRSFQMAGARTVINSLWKVPDKQTAQLMQSLYANPDIDLPRIMREMALGQLARLRSRNMPDHPFSWAPFVAVGDWHSLR